MTGVEEAEGRNKSVPWALKSGAWELGISMVNALVVDLLSLPRCGGHPSMHESQYFIVVQLSNVGRAVLTLNGWVYSCYFTNVPNFLGYASAALGTVIKNIK